MSRFKVAVGLVAVAVAQVALVIVWDAERVQGVVAGLTMCASIWFVAVYSRDPWWENPFGQSLMLIALALFLGSLVTVLYRLFGEYVGRSFMLIASADIALLAMVMRTRVLRAAQRRELDSRKP